MFFRPIVDYSSQRWQTTIKLRALSFFSIKILSFSSRKTYRLSGTLPYQSAFPESSATLFVVLPQFLLVLLVIGFASRDKVLKEHAVIDDLYVEDEERTEASDADTVHVVIADQLLAVGNLIQA